MLSFFGLGKSKAQERESTEEQKGIIGRYLENELPVIMRFVNELPNKKTIEKLPFLTVVSWKYDGNENNGMPPKIINGKMIVLEKALEDAMDKTDIFTNAYSRTGNNLKELVYYTTKQDDFMAMLNRALKKHDIYPIEINFYEDKEWTDFKKVLNDFKEK
ncbi:DUF695 domain-containing protein [Ulvibacterium sp.]|uniref:DUF695 domain-containing protein n=1 Tax=Ulvibacterium sp. TaxID=2665914 RepID=UPI003BAAF47E